MRIALFGGTFDPPHRGHLAIAKAAADAFTLDRVLFAPTGLQPLKLGAPRTPFADRLAMVAAACTVDPRFAACDIDSPRSDGTPNYTVDTLAAFAALHQNDSLFNLVGADSFLSIRRWREPDRLLELAEWIVVSRPGYPVSALELDSLALSAVQKTHVHIIDGVAEEISASALRHRVRNGYQGHDLLPEPVAKYIVQHCLYR